MFKIRSLVVLGLVLVCIALVSVNADPIPSQKTLCPCVALPDFKPVCGTDGHTYQNKVKLNCANRCFNTNIGIAHEGACDQN